MIKTEKESNESLNIPSDDVTNQNMIDSNTTGNQMDATVLLAMKELDEKIEVLNTKISTLEQSQSTPIPTKEHVDQFLASLTSDQLQYLAQRLKDHLSAVRTDSGEVPEARAPIQDASGSCEKNRGNIRTPKAEIIEPERNNEVQRDIKEEIEDPEFLDVGASNPVVETENQGLSNLPIDSSSKTCKRASNGSLPNAKRANPEKHHFFWFINVKAENARDFSELNAWAQEKGLRIHNQSSMKSSHSETTWTQQFSVCDPKDVKIVESLAESSDWINKFDGLIRNQLSTPFLLPYKIQNTIKMMLVARWCKKTKYTNMKYDEGYRQSYKNKALWYYARDVGQSLYEDLDEHGKKGFMALAKEIKWNGLITGIKHFNNHF